MSSMYGASTGQFGQPIGKPLATGIPGVKSQTFQNFTPEQMQLFSRMFGSVTPDSYLSKLASGDTSQFGAMERPALQQFNDISANIANRYSGQGLGARKSSGFQNEQTSAAQDFAAKLQANRLGIQNSAIQQLHQMSRDLLQQNPYVQHYFGQQEEPMSFLEKLFKSIGPLAGTGIGGAVGGWPGAKIGGSIGSQFSQAFS